MEEGYTAGAVRERLIIAGIRELETHGLNDFSLRRVAVASEVSCAAPYRHFRDKEELILEIIRYINRQWTLLQEQILAVFPSDDTRALCELGVAHIRFWIANPNFRSVLLLDTDAKEEDPRLFERRKISEGLTSLIRAYCQRRGDSAATEAEKSYAFLALIYGTVLMLGNRELANDDATISMIRTRLSDILTA
ncbi:MAG: TetR/AcrR family transcriptional regulator [Clostridia bacterium]|nr:TetR/AcrR family transcriptional regulator [Clostridia bacterium]MBQ2248829.1 TetR/AcrR family transcriptional regulator [Clostridia bacterium]MBQ5613092.1 TetR/AcrR family transcriptional regulator [Clostridia bacterium]MBQ5771902.1 TetR/AcrR family transcriptional regulator [Clostridia bacterium]